MAATATFAEHRAAIAALPNRPLTDADVRRSEFRLLGDPALEIFYAPVDRLNTAARVMLVGLNPGAAQMRAAFEAARDALRAGLDEAAAQREAAIAASFCGCIRTSLVGMLDQIGLATAMSLTSTTQLWEDAVELVQFSSAVRFPAFVHAQDYRGDSPRLLSTPALRSYVDDVLLPEIDQVPGALIVPVGRAVAPAIELAVADRRIDPRRVIAALPDPGTGAAGFAQRRAMLTEQVARRFSLAA